MDEYDLIPDPFASDDVDWQRLLAPQSPEYFPDDDTLDESFLAELEMLDSTAPRPTIQPLTSPLKPSITGSKRKKSSTPSPDSPRKRKKSVLEDELTCPICFDIFVATHVLSCGHSYCAPCAWPWITENKKCPLCRAPLADTTMIRNICMDSIVQMYIETQSSDGDRDWQVGGQKLLDFRERQRKWKDAVAERKKHGSVVRPIVLLLLSDEDDDEIWNT